LREHQRDHRRARAVTHLRAVPFSCAAFVPAASRPCPQFPPRRSMVRRRPWVRVPQRASKVLQIGRLCCPARRPRPPLSSRGRHGVSAGPRGAYTGQAKIADRVLYGGSTRSLGAVTGRLGQEAHAKITGGDLRVTGRPSHRQDAGMPTWSGNRVQNPDRRSPAMTASHPKPSPEPLARLGRPRRPARANLAAVTSTTTPRHRSSLASGVVTGG
jgi:hypothetical protein